MLQQTRTETVRPYFERFLRRFPTVHRLARARLDTVLKLWEGLGYYGRARNLHEAAGIIVRAHGGELPADRDALRKLPGVGRYTAGAVASIAFGADVPVLDGNVTRLLCRAFRIRQDCRAPAVQDRLWRLARDLIPRGRAGTFNQAMMELGSTICRPRRPRCSDCPLADACEARVHGEQEKLPVRRPHRSLPHRRAVAGIIRKRGRILIDKRRPEGLLGGLWEFPGGKCEPGESPQDALRREVREEVGVRAEVREHFITVRQSYSHFHLILHVYDCRWVSGRARAIDCAAVKWVRPEELGRYAFPAANQKVVASLNTRGSKGRPAGR